jgi:hypothetical protein
VKRLLGLGRVLPSVLLLFFAVAVAGNGGCRKPEEDADVLPPAGLSLSATPPVVVSPMGPTRFGRGWFPIESNAQGSWRWMGQIGEIHVPTLQSKAHLRILGWAPVELLGTPPTIRISVNGKELDHFAPPIGRFKNGYDVAQEVQGPEPESIVRLETSATASAPGDPRALGFALVSVSWTPAPGLEARDR